MSALFRLPRWLFAATVGNVLLAPPVLAQDVACRDRDGEFLAQRACPPGSTPVRTAGSGSQNTTGQELVSPKAGDARRSTSTAAICRNEKGGLVLAAECEKTEETVRAGDASAAAAAIATEKERAKKNWCSESRQKLSSERNTALMDQYLNDCVRPEDAKRVQAAIEKNQEEAAEREKLARLKAAEERAARAEQAAREAQQAAANASSEAAQAKARATEAERVAGQDYYYPPVIRPLPTPKPTPKTTPKSATLPAQTSVTPSRP